MVHFHGPEQDGRRDDDACLFCQLSPQAIEQLLSGQNVTAGKGQAAPGDVNQNHPVA